MWRSGIVRRRNDARQRRKMSARAGAADGRHQGSLDRGGGCSGDAVGVGEVELVVVSAQQSYVFQFQQRLERAAIPLKAGFSRCDCDVCIRDQVAAGGIAGRDRRN